MDSAVYELILWFFKTRSWLFGVVPEPEETNVLLFQ